MERRDFIKLCSVAGLGLASTGIPGAVPEARAAGSRFHVTFHAVGGWDVTMLLDPKGREENSLGRVVNRYYSKDDIPMAGNIPVAPNLGPDDDSPIIQGNNYNFMNRFKDIATVINGIDAETNGHDSGQRNTWSGRLAQGSPAFAALLAVAEAETLPMSFLTNGGYDFTAGVVAPTRVGSLNALQALIYPNETNPGNENTGRYHTLDTVDRIAKARAERLDAQIAKQQLPRIKSAMGLLYTSRLGVKDLQEITKYLPDDLPNNNLQRQVYVALAAYAAGLTKSVNLVRGGWDSHSNNDGTQDNRYAEFLAGITTLFDRALEIDAEHGTNIYDELFVMVGSDFSRTMVYNDGDGKDHWSNSSLLILSSQIPGNRVIGLSDDAGRPQKMDLATLQPSESGQLLKNGHIHKWLRKFSGIEDNEIVKLFPLNAEGEISLS